ncbi:hypothetical protein VOLCADRAFT_107747 [Volvox carteri f. nagariensis]|uniref:Uncharacterized protein n=1 Tax=Volvox carteri f. nagariensis TaxID=3068 RepID=D8UG22_VOLCA|nr:uncharacterized protein VOLCADRAFT_107747 [Volvox carteri f. nagariensis]EFJ41303.1 hypothetical protein VOLCADRAFT_107747 [Volvox carteri f. nagariensis]|eukprot:XP_002957637.1 hypothetical protein VOLCADRAFT_107747 [Volvox carteri f. nagariensis]
MPDVVHSTWCRKGVDQVESFINGHLSFVESEACAQSLHCTQRPPLEGRELLVSKTEHGFAHQRKTAKVLEYLRTRQDNGSPQLYLQQIRELEPYIRDSYSSAVIAERYVEGLDPAVRERIRTKYELTPREGWHAQLNSIATDAETIWINLQQAQAERERHSSSDHASGSKQAITSEREKRLRKQPSKSRDSGSGQSKFYCKHHGANSSHDSKDCRVLNGRPTGSSKSAAATGSHQPDELAAMITAAVQSALGASRAAMVSTSEQQAPATKYAADQQRRQNRGGGGNVNNGGASNRRPRMYDGPPCEYCGRYGHDEPNCRLRDQNSRVGSCTWCLFEAHTEANVGRGATVRFRGYTQAVSQHFIKRNAGKSLKVGARALKKTHRHFVSTGSVMQAMYRMLHLGTPHKITQKQFDEAALQTGCKGLTAFAALPLFGISQEGLAIGGPAPGKATATSNFMTQFQKKVLDKILRPSTITADHGAVAAAVGAEAVDTAANDGDGGIAAAATAGGDTGTGPRQGEAGVAQDEDTTNYDASKEWVSEVPRVAKGAAGKRRRGGGDDDDLGTRPKHFKFVHTGILYLAMVDFWEGPHVDFVNVRLPNDGFTYVHSGQQEEEIFWHRCGSWVELDSMLLMEFFPNLTKIVVNKFASTILMGGQYCPGCGQFHATS